MVPVEKIELNKLSGDQILASLMTCMRQLPRLAMQGRTGSVAQEGRLPLRHLWPFVAIILLLENVFITQDVDWVVGLWHVSLIGHDDHILEVLLELRPKLHDSVVEGEVDTQDMVFRMIQDVEELFGRKPWVDGMYNTSEACRAEQIRWTRISE